MKPSYSLLTASLFLFLPTLTACNAAIASDPNPTLDNLDAALTAVEQSTAALIGGVANGSVDLKKEGPTIMLGFTRMTLSLTRIQTLSHKPGLMATPPSDPVAEAAVDGSTVEGAPVEGIVPEGSTELASASPTSAKTAHPSGTTSKAQAAPPTTDTSAKTAPPTPEAAVAPVASDTFEKTGIKSIDSFFDSANQLTAAMASSQAKMESARNSLTTGLGLSKKFSSDEVKTALKEKLGTGYKISMGPPSKITPGADAKDPAIVGTLQGAISNLLSLKTDLPKLITSAVDLGKKAAEIPTSAKSDLAALGPVGSAQAVAKVAK
jgi:hypothetical protein